MSGHQKTSPEQKSSIHKTDRFLEPLLKNPSGSHRIENLRNGRILAETIVGAFDSRSRRTGLLRQSSLPPGHALIIAPSSAIHTFSMTFPIDVAFIARNGRVVKICAAVQPWRIAYAVRAYAAIELPSGLLESCETRAGDILSIEISPTST